MLRVKATSDPERESRVQYLDAPTPVFRGYAFNLKPPFRKPAAEKFSKLLSSRCVTIVMGIEQFGRAELKVRAHYHTLFQGISLIHSIIAARLFAEIRRFAAASVLRKIE